MSRGLGDVYKRQIRNIGLMGAIHFNSDGIPANEFAPRVFQRCYENDVLVRFSVDYLVISPSLIVQPEQIERISDALRAAISSIN